jgi:hypothetical protein
MGADKDLPGSRNEKEDWAKHRPEGKKIVRKGKGRARKL